MAGGGGLADQPNAAYGVIGLSLVTNLAAGIAPEQLDHKEVLGVCQELCVSGLA